MPALYVLLLNQDDPRKCTGRKLVRFGLAIPLRRYSEISRKTLVLDPYAQPLHAKEAREFVSITVIDGSWRSCPSLFPNLMPGIRRRLPLLLAGNPTHYSKLGLLSSAEAMAAALYVRGSVNQAIKILNLFKWGQTFLALNREPLEAYSQTRNPEEVSKLEAEFFPTRTIGGTHQS